MTSRLVTARGVHEVAQVAISDAAQAVGAQFANVNLLDADLNTFE